MRRVFFFARALRCALAAPTAELQLNCTATLAVLFVCERPFGGVVLGCPLGAFSGHALPLSAEQTSKELVGCELASS